MSMGFSRQEYWSGLPCLLQGIFLTQELNLCLLHLLHCRCILYHLSHQGSHSDLIGSVQFSLSVVSDSWRPHGLQHARPPCSSPAPGVYSDSCPLRRRQWQPTPVLLLENPMDGGALWAAVHGVAGSRTRLRDFTFTFHFDALEKEMATRSSVLTWRIPGTGEPGGLPFMGSHRVRHD